MNDHHDNWDYEMLPLSHTSEDRQLIGLYGELHAAIIQAYRIPDPSTRSQPRTPTVTADRIADPPLNDQLEANQNQQQSRPFRWWRWLLLGFAIGLVIGIGAILAESNDPSALFWMVSHGG